MNKVKSIITNKYFGRGLIILFSVVFLCFWVERKEGYHVDEILAYELANAEFNPWIVPTQPQGRLAKFVEEHIDAPTTGEMLENLVWVVKDTLQNRGNSVLLSYKADVYDAPVWITNATFQDYLQVDGGDDFNLLSVYFNVKDDNHPPIHFMLLHLVCSVFQGQITPWHGCAINLLAMAIGLWLLGKIGEYLNLRESSILAMMVGFGFSTGMIALTLWIRMYGLLTLWILWVFYLHLKLWKEETFITAFRGRAALVVSVLLVFWTQYFGLFFVLPIAAVTVFGFAKAKRRTELWKYIRTMLLAAILGVALFPFAISDVLYSGRGREALSKFGNGLEDFLVRAGRFGEILADNTVGNIWLFLLLILIPVIFFVVKRQKVGGVFWGLLLIPGMTFFIMVSKVSPYFEERYIMPLFPLTILLIVWLWDGMLGDKKGVVLFLMLGLICIQGISRQGTHKYLYTGYEEQVELAREYQEYPMVCLYDGSGYYENIVEMGYYEQTILVKTQELEQMDDARKAVTQQGYVVLIKLPGEDNGREQLEKVMDTFGGSEEKLLYAGGCHKDAIYLVSP